jgi:hypothetical protein
VITDACCGQVVSGETTPVLEPGGSNGRLPRFIGVDQAAGERGVSAMTLYRETASSSHGVDSSRRGVTFGVTLSVRARRAPTLPLVSGGYSGIGHARWPVLIVGHVGDATCRSLNAGRGRFDEPWDSFDSERSTWR